jgi:hypothetical protein
MNNSLGAKGLWFDSIRGGFLPWLVLLAKIDIPLTTLSS